MFRVMRKIFSLLEELKQNPRGRHMQFLLFGSYSIVLIVMAISMGITLKFGSDIASLGSDILGKRFPYSIELLKLKQDINQANSLLNSFNINKNKSIQSSFLKTQNNALEKAKLLLIENSFPQDTKDKLNAIHKNISDISLLSKSIFEGNPSLHTFNKNTHLINVMFSDTSKMISNIISEQLSSSQLDGKKLETSLNHVLHFNIGIMVIALISGFIIVILITKSVIGLLDELQQSRQQSEKTKHEAEQKAKELQHTSHALLNTNEHLKDSLKKLNDTQDQLVQNEKMASLGGLVAGISHEINTPIGIGVTAASHLQDNISAFKSKFENNALKKSEMAEFVKNSNEASEILLKNLNRAATLIRSFKQVAIDQTTEELRQFELKEYLDGIILSLRPKLKNTNIKIKLICPESLELNSYPGAYSQIITNFILNSLIHAYEKDAEGTIIIEVIHEGDHIQIIYCDDGKGVPEDHITKLFEPFFTTRRGRGGSGIGLHLVYNIVTQQLHGSIAVSNNELKGICFRLVIPVS